MLRAPHRRFAAWYAWKGFKSQEEAAKVIGCTQAHVSTLLDGTANAGLKVGAQIEDATGDWPRGPIRAREWLPSKQDRSSARVAPLAPTPERAKPVAPGNEGPAAERALQTVGHDHPFADDVTETNLRPTGSR